MFPARLLKTLRSHVYDTRAAAIIPHRGKGVRPIIPRLSARICDRRGLIPPDTERYAFLLSLSLFLRTIDSGADSSGSESLEKFHARSGGSVPRPRDVENELIFGFAVGKVKSRYRIEGGGGIMKTICERIERSRVKIEKIFFICVSMDYESINNLYLKRVLEALRVVAEGANSIEEFFVYQLCTFIMLIIIIILAMIKYIFLKSTFRNY